MWTRKTPNTDTFHVVKRLIGSLEWLFLPNTLKTAVTTEYSFRLQTVINPHCQLQQSLIFCNLISTCLVINISHNSFLMDQLYERKQFTFGSTRCSKNVPGLKIFFSLYDEKLYLVHKRTESGPEIALNFKGQFYNCNLPNVLHSSIFHSVQAKPQTVTII